MENPKAWKENRKAALSRVVTLVDANSSKASAGFAVAMAIAL